MMKKELLFVTHHLTVGGVQKSLISALGAVNYDEYNVTLYVRKNRLDIIDYIDKRVSVIVNTINKHYYRSPYALYLLGKSVLFKVLRCQKKQQVAEKCLSEYITKRMMEDEQRKYLNKKKYDIAIAYVQSITALFVERYVKANKKIVFYQGSTDEWHDVNAVELPKFDRIVVEHIDIKRLLLEWYERINSKQVVILANYTDPQLLKKQSLEYHIEREKDKVMLCTCSRFSSVKGIDIAVKVAKILKDKGYTFIWYLVGDGSEMVIIREMINECCLNDCINLIGMQTNPYPYMAACDIYVQPSREEALSIAMLESQILCAPMVSTKTAGGLAMIQEGVNGLLADINPSSLAEKIELLMKDDSLRKQIKDNLSAVDYSEEEQRYKQDWEKLLR